MSDRGQQGDALRSQIADLHSEHRDLDDIISRITGDGAYDQLQMQRLKKRKLMIKDQIKRLENQLFPDLIA